MFLNDIVGAMTVEEASALVAKAKKVAMEDAWHSEEKGNSWSSENTPFGNEDPFHGEQDEWQESAEPTKTVAKTWDQLNKQERLSGVKGRTVWNEKTKKYTTVFDVPATEQVVAEAEPMNLNDDDWYEVNPATKTIVGTINQRPQQAVMGRPVKLPNGNYAVKGMTAKHLGLQQAVGEGYAGINDTDTVGFSVNSEAAYTAVMDQFGDHIDHNETSGIMYVPASMWPNVEAVAFDADGVGSEQDDGYEHPDSPEQDVAQEGLSDTVKRGIKNVKRGLKGWSKDAEVNGYIDNRGDPRALVNKNKGYSDDTVKRLHSTLTGPGPGFPFRNGDYDGKDKHSPAGLQKRVLDREMNKRGLGEQGVAEGFFGIDDKIKGKIQNIVSDLSDIPGMWDHKAQTFTDAGMDKLKTVLKNNPKYIKYALNLNYRDYEAEGAAEGWKDKVAGAALAGSMAMGGAPAHAGFAGDLAQAAARGLGAGVVAGAAGPSIFKKQNAADLAFAEQIPDAEAKAKFLKAARYMRDSRDMSIGDAAMIGANAFDEARFKKLKQKLATQYNIQPAVQEGEIERQHGDIKPWAYWSFPERVAKKLYQIHKGQPIDKSAIVQLWKTDGPDRMTKFMLKPDVSEILAYYQQMCEQGVQEGFETEPVKLNPGDQVTYQGKSAEVLSVAGNNVTLRVAGAPAPVAVAASAVSESKSYWHQLQTERNTKINSLVNELNESIKGIK